MAKVIPAATTAFGGPIASATSMPTDTLPAGGGGTGIAAGSNLPDTALAITVTGKRFYWEAKINWPGNGGTPGMGIGFTGTARWVFSEIEMSTFTNNAYGLSRATSTSLTNTTFTSPQVVVGITTNSLQGAVYGRGWIDYATSGTYTLTPVYYNSTASNAYYQRAFRVDTWLP